MQGIMQTLQLQFCKGLLQSENSKPFMIPIMVDRMSAILQLNYVLQLLIQSESK